MNTTYKPVDPEFLHMLAGAKARGLSWTRLAELSKIPVGELEVIPWREPKEWAKASKYAEKLVAHEVLAETLVTLRLQMNDPVNNGRLKAQLANSVVKVVQLQQQLRIAPKSKLPALRPRPTPSSTPIPIPPPPPTAKPADHVAPPVSVPTPTKSANPLVTVAAMILLLLVGGLTSWAAMVCKQPTSSQAWVWERSPLPAPQGEPSRRCLSGDEHKSIAWFLPEQSLVDGRHPKSLGFP